jgi:hypothetical protein
MTHKKISLKLAGEIRSRNSKLKSKKNNTAVPERPVSTGREKIFLHFPFYFLLRFPIN